MRPQRELSWDSEKVWDVVSGVCCPGELNDESESNLITDARWDGGWVFATRAPVVVRDFWLFDKAASRSPATSDPR